ncbi:MAG: dihydroorotase, partial [Chitinophagaceae bacterium]
SEEITIRRDIALSEYAESNLHITGISLASSVEIIRQAKKSNTRISCSVPLHNLMFTEEELLSGYNPLFKLSPPLRSATDRSALIEGIMDGTIDIITTHHTAQHNDVKICEFEYAAHGALGLEAAFGILNELKIDVENILNCICYNPRKVFGLECILEEGAEADITLFTEDFSYEFTSAMNQSKSKNSPYLGRTLKGKIIGSILNKQMNEINLHV